MTVVLVQRRHVDKGRQRNVQCCPIALAFQEATGDKSWRVYLWRGGALAVRGKYIAPFVPRVELPRECRDFAEAFDFGGARAVESMLDIRIEFSFPEEETT